MPTPVTGAEPFSRADRELWAELRELQKGDLVVALPALYIVAGILIVSLNRLEDVYHTGLITLGFLFLPPAVWFLRRTSHASGTALLVLGPLVLLFLFVHWQRVGAALPLLAFPLGLAALFAGVPTGLLLAGLCSVLLACAAPSLLPVDSDLRLVAILASWGAVGLVWLTQRPLVAAIEWYLFSYRRSHELLEQARDSQLHLKQVLHDLAEANQQLTRMNRLADSLRHSAEDARRAKQEFVANVSHELRTPLNMIIGFCEMILQAPEVYGQLSPTLLGDLEVVLRNSHYLSRLVDDVLDLSQIEANKMALTRERATLSELVEAAVVAARPLFHSKGLYLEVEPLPDVPPLFCDRTRIRQVLLNLLTNAGRFTEHGGVRLCAWQEGAEVVVSVADTGPGIPA